MLCLLGYFFLIQIPTRTIATAIAMIMAIAAATIVIVGSIGCGYCGGAVVGGASSTFMKVSA